MPMRAVLCSSVLLQERLKVSKSLRPQCRVFMAISEDGFVARSDGSMDWLDECNRLVPDGEDCGYADFMASIDALVMGRKTFDTVRSFGQWPYGDKRVVVLSHRLSNLPVGTPESVRLTHGEPLSVVQMLSSQGFFQLYIDGGTTARSFLEAGLIDELILTQVPVRLGHGIELLGPQGLPSNLKLRSSKTYFFGFVQSRYLVHSVESPDEGQKVMP
jgi:dihydrofolate reductase